MVKRKVQNGPHLWKCPILHIIFHKLDVGTKIPSKKDLQSPFCTGTTFYHLCAQDAPFHIQNIEIDTPPSMSSCICTELLIMSENQFPTDKDVCSQSVFAKSPTYEEKNKSSFTNLHNCSLLGICAEFEQNAP